MQKGGRMAQDILLGGSLMMASVVALFTIVFLVARAVREKPEAA
jgi:hypothetical protein